MNIIPFRATTQDQDELKRTFGGALKGLFMLDFDLYIEYVKTLIWLFEHERQEELHILECLTSYEMFEEYIAELPKGYEGTSFFVKNTVLCLLSHIIDNELQKKLVEAYLDSLNH